jgi:quinol monooxygenase YgiN
MALMGRAALAMWWEMDPAMRTEFEHWHSHEHFPERLALPGFLRASRWSHAGGGPGYFVLYELERHETLASPQYLARLNDPTPWSRRLMPHHANMVRSQCRVLESRGGAIARRVLTLRVSPRPGHEDALRAHLRELIDELVWMPGLTAGHLLRTEAPALAPTTEQEIRGGRDREADWVLLLCGCDAAALESVRRSCLDGPALQRAGAAADVSCEVYALSHSALASDVCDLPALRPAGV